MLEVIEKHIKQIEIQLQQCTSQYHSLTGAKQILDKLYADAQAASLVVEDVVEPVEEVL